MAMKRLSVLVFFAAAGLAAEHSVGPPAADSKEFGQVLIAEYDVESAQIERFRQHVPSAKVPGESAVESVLLAKTEDWHSPPILPSAGKPPFTVVATVTGMVITDGDAGSMWLAGWRNEEGVSKQFPLLGLSKAAAQAGQLLTLTAAARPVRFEESKSYQAELGLVRLNNFRLQTVHVQIWSGLGEANPVQVLLATPLIWVGLTMAVLFWWFRRR